MLDYTHQNLCLSFILEVLLTKLQYAYRDKFQIVGMSATLPNINELAQWLDAVLYTSNFRPVPLHEYALVGNTVYNNQWQSVRLFFYSLELLFSFYLIHEHKYSVFVYSNYHLGFDFFFFFSNRCKQKNRGKINMFTVITLEKSECTTNG